MINTFLHNVIWLRKHYGLTKKAMAEKLGISLWMLNKIENGELPPGLQIDVLFQIRKEFGVSMENSLSVWLGLDEYEIIEKTPCEEGNTGN